MKFNDYKVLRIMEELHSDAHISQRTLSEKLNMSLGLVNAFIKHLTAKGYFKAKTLPKRRVKYMLTRDGAAEKTKLVYDYVRHSFELYRGAYTRICSMIKTLDDTGVRSVALYGNSTILDMTYQELSKTDIRIMGLVDDYMVDSSYRGHDVVGLNHINRLSFEKLIVTACDNDLYSIEKIMAAGIERHNIVTLDGGI